MMRFLHEDIYKSKIDDLMSKCKTLEIIAAVEFCAIIYLVCLVIIGGAH